MDLGNAIGLGLGAMGVAYLGVQQARSMYSRIMTAKYSVPFKEDVNFGFGMNPLREEFKHPGKRKEAWDFKVPEGTEILAARGGEVLDVIVSSNLQGHSSILEDTASDSRLRQKYEDGTNWMMVDHGDGTYGLYAHLKYQGAVVEKGARVRERQPIGYSGNTGLSTEPHIHFEVVRLTEEGDPLTLIKRGKTRSIPIIFRNLELYLENLLSSVRQYQSTQP